MNGNVKLLRRLEAARRRVRDASAAEVQQAETEHAEAQRRTAEAEALVEHVIDARVVRLAEQRDAVELLRLADEIERARAGSAVAREAEAEAHGEVVAAVSLLRTRAVELRASERVLESALASRRQRVDRHEQRTSDDLAATRTRARRDER